MSAPFNKVIRVLWIEDENRHLAIELQIPRFLTALCGVDAQMCTIEIVPDRCDLWLSIWHYGCYRANERTLQQVKRFFRNCDRHFAFLHHRTKNTLSERCG